MTKPKLERGWLKRELKAAWTEVQKWPAWRRNVELPHHLNLWNATEPRESGEAKE